MQYPSNLDMKIRDFVERNETSDEEEQETYILEDENDSKNSFTTLSSTLAANRPNNLITRQLKLNSIDNLICYAELQNYNCEKFLLLKK